MTFEREKAEPVLLIFVKCIFKVNDSLFCTGEMSNNEYELTFLVTVSGLGLETYFIRQLKAEEEPSEELSIATVRLFHTEKQPFQV